MRANRTWKATRLGDVVSIVGGGTPSRRNAAFWGGSIPWATVKDFVSLDLDCTQESITEDGLKESASNLIPPGRVILPTRMGLGKAAINSIPIAINQDLKALECCEALDARYLLRWIVANAAGIERMGSGATVKGITLPQLTSLEIPLPPFPEQRRIAAILDKADAIRRKRRETIRLLDDFLRSVFLDMFGDPMANPKGWPMGTISDLAASTQYGTSKKAAGVGKFPYIRMGNITYEGGWDFSDMKFIDLADDELSRYIVRQGEVLFNRTNSRDLVGKTAVFREPEPMVYAGYLVKLAANEAGDGEYIAAAMNTSSVKAYLRAKCKNIIGMANINAHEFRNIPVPLPPVELQQRYAQIVHRTLDARKRLACSVAELETLFFSLSQKAFSGELLTRASESSGQRISFEIPAKDRITSKDPSVYLMQFVLLLLQEANGPVRLIDVARAYVLLNWRDRIRELAMEGPNRSVVDAWSRSFAERIDVDLFGSAIHNMAMKRKEISLQGEGQDVTVSATQFAAIPEPISPWRRLDAQIAYWAVSTLPQIVFEEDSMATVVFQMTRAALAA